MSENFLGWNAMQYTCRVGCREHEASLSLCGDVHHHWGWTARGKPEVPAVGAVPVLLSAESPTLRRTQRSVLNR